jgi:hypothetical protein
VTAATRCANWNTPYIRNHGSRARSQRHETKAPQPGGKRRRTKWEGPPDRPIPLNRKERGMETVNILTPLASVRSEECGWDAGSIVRVLPD